jgi:glyoxylase-like metal-dependent hydrolase (beta-lactamase superfamily II)
MVEIRIEDEVEDVLRKAMRGQGLSVEALAARSGEPVEDVSRVLSGEIGLPAAEVVVGQLGLGFERLCRLAAATSGPPVELPEGVILDNTAFPVLGYEEMTVNSYQICPPPKGSGSFVIDTGANAAALMERLKQSGDALQALFLTHTHRDHVAAYDAISNVAEARFAPEGEPFGGAATVRPGDGFKFGNWSLEARRTSGHSVGGLTYVLDADGQTLAFVGDAIFCYSIGKADGAYAKALKEVRIEVLSLPDETILCPGHGPLTTVAFEKANNPFFLTD